MTLNKEIRLDGKGWGIVKFCIRLLMKSCKKFCWLT